MVENSHAVMCLKCAETPWVTRPENKPALLNCGSKVRNSNDEIKTLTDAKNVVQRSAHTLVGMSSIEKISGSAARKRVKLRNEHENGLLAFVESSAGHDGKLS